jgi:hypothetical protein
MTNDLWQNAKKGEVNRKVIEYVSEVERNQSDLFNRFAKLAWLYDSYSKTYEGDRRSKQALVSENVIASNVDTVSSAISVTKVRPRFMTDGGDWSTQRRARQLELYAGQLIKKLKVHKQARRGFKEGALKGTGLVKVIVDRFSRIKVERALVDDIIVDNAEARLAEPQQMHHRMFVNREVLISRFPAHADAIKASYGSLSTEAARMWADYRPVEQSEVVVIESWYLPLGVKGQDGYKPGRHVISMTGTDLFDEKYHKDFFPFAVFKWNERPTGWYGIGGAERIAGHQRELNKNNWQIDRQIQQLAVPTTYVRPADAKLAIQTVNRAGTVVVINDEFPKTIIPPAVSGEQYARREAIKASAYEEFGVSRMAASAAKPSGLDSGVALREYRDQTTQRFATQEQDFEEYVLRITLLIIDKCKDLGADAPEIERRSRFGPRKIKWGDVDMGEVEVQIEAASQLAKTPAGRTALAMEMAQAGLISKDMAMRDMEHPDMVQTMSIYTAGIENLERIIEEILDGATLVPEPTQPLQLGVWRFTAAINQAENNGAPEDVIERLRNWSNTAAWMLSEQERKVQEEMAGLQAAAGAPAPQMPSSPGAAPELMTGAGVGAADFQ